MTNPIRDRYYIGEAMDVFGMFLQQLCYQPALSEASKLYRLKWTCHNHKVFVSLMGRVES